MMTQSNRTEHDTKIQELKTKFERDGYDVVVEPQKFDLPFDLGNYIPDLVARKHAGGLIVEVKTANAKTSIERYQSVALAVQKHTGWRFLLVTVDDLSIPTSSTEMANWDELVVKLGTVRSLIDNGNDEPAVLYLWSIFEAAMRKLALTVVMPIERLPATRLINQLYTAGYISVDDYATAKKFLTTRNGITHGFGTPVDSSLLESFFHVVSSLIQEWKNEPYDSAIPDE